MLADSRAAPRLRRACFSFLILYLICAHALQVRTEAMTRVFWTRVDIMCVGMVPGESTAGIALAALPTISAPDSPVTICRLRGVCPTSDPHLVVRRFADLHGGALGGVLGLAAVIFGNAPLLSAYVQAELNCTSAAANWYDIAQHTAPEFHRPSTWELKRTFSQLCCGIENNRELAGIQLHAQACALLNSCVVRMTTRLHLM